MPRSNVTSVLATVPSSSNDAVRYEIRRGADRTVYCTCPSWKFQRVRAADRTCKHIKAFAAGQLATKPTEGAEPVLPKSEAASLLKTAKKKAAEAAAIERKYQEARREGLTPSEASFTAKWGEFIASLPKDLGEKSPQLPLLF